LDNLCDLLFELSSRERMNIMQILLQESLKLSHVSQRLDMTVTETSRHLQRLSDVQLVQKEVDGRFSPTKYGELAIMLLSDLKFVSDNREYFLDHDISNLPYEFSNRLGELVSSTYEIDAVMLMARVFSILEEAEEYIWAKSYQFSPNMVPLVQDKVANGVDFRGIYPRDVDIPPDLEHRVHFRDNIEIRLLVTEKEAMAGFKHRSEQPRYTGFFSKDPKFRKWCRDVFQYFWQQSV